jgi:hypothetical protein
MSLPKPFSQCSLSDLAPAICADASAAGTHALDPATANRLLQALSEAGLTEAVLMRHSGVRYHSGLKCDGSASSERAWCRMLRDLADAAGVDVSDAALLRVYHVCKECAKCERAQLRNGTAASAAVEHGGALTASPAPAAACHSASSSLSAAHGPPLTFTYHDRFLGKAVRIPVVQLLQIAAPLMLITPALHFARGRAAAGAPPQHPAPPVDCTRVELLLAQRTRFMFGFTLKACNRASTAPASSYVYFRTASRWSAGILRRVMAGYGSKVQVRWLLRNSAGACFADARCSKLGRIIGLNAHQHGSAARCIPPPPPAHSPRVPQAAAAARLSGKGDVFVAARRDGASLVGDHIIVDPECVHKKCSECDSPAHALLKCNSF